MTKQDYLKVASSTNLNYSEADLFQALNSLVQKGIMEEVVINGEVHYNLTEWGKMVGKHMLSDPKTKN